MLTSVFWTGLGGWRKEVSGAIHPKMQLHGLKNNSHKIPTSPVTPMDLSQCYRNLMQFWLAIITVPDIHFLDQTCLCDNELQPMSCKKGE
jgi:hypothetical protein